MAFRDIHAGNFYLPLRCWMMLPPFRTMFARTNIGLEPGGGAGFNKAKSEKKEMEK
jgi:hypothetical protein